MLPEASHRRFTTSKTPEWMSNREMYPFGLTKFGEFCFASILMDQLLFHVVFFLLGFISRNSGEITHRRVRRRWTDMTDQPLSRVLHRIQHLVSCLPLLRRVLWRFYPYRLPYVFPSLDCRMIVLDSCLMSVLFLLTLISV